MRVKGKLKFLVAFAIAFMAMMAMKTLVFKVITIEGDALEPLYSEGDRVIVNRWSYGLRVGGSDGIFSYGRLGRSNVSRGDLVVFESPETPSQLIIARCTALPGDTIRVPSDSQTIIIPSLANCATSNYYWMEPPNEAHGFLIPEECIIGKPLYTLHSSFFLIH